MKGHEFERMVKGDEEGQDPEASKCSGLLETRFKLCAL